MASNYTENYGLCQWEATDQVLRTDFNEDNAKVDEALKSASDLAQAAQTLAGAAYSPENSPFVVGSYTGDGTAKRKIELGFTPKAVLVVHSNGVTAYRGTSSFAYYGGLALTDYNASTVSSEGVTEWNSERTIIALTEGGFFVNETSYIYCNNSNKLYYYLAVR